MKQRVFWKVISATLSVVMLLQAATFVAFSETSEPTDQIGTAEAEPVLVGEITEKRTENEKYFLYSDNSVVAAVYPDAVHYEDAGGNMQAIDNRLIDTTDGSDAYAQNTANLWNIKFAKKAKDGKLAKLKYKTHNISWYLQGAEKTEGTPVAATESIGEEAHAVYGTSSGMRYSDILKDTDLEYLLIGTEIKENIILHTADAVTDYTFVYDVGALTMELRDNTLCLQDGEETVLFLSAPVMQDAAMEYNYDITLSLVPLKENNGKHVYAVTVSPNKEWALSQERVFPITIDPTLTTEQDKNHIVDTYVDSSEPTITHHNATTLKVGMNTTSKLYRIFLKFDLPELLGAHDRVVSAYLNLHPNTTAADLATMAQKAPAILIYEPLADWDATTLTWNNQPWNQTATYNSTAKDYDMVGAKGSQSAYRWYQWDITDTVDKWYTTGNNKGLMLKYYDESSLGSNMVVNYVSTQTAVSNAAFPVVTFRYINMLGLEDYWTYQTLDNGIAGTAYINNFTGGLTTITPLASVASELMPINVSLIYSPDSVNRSINSLSPGKGFMLNLQACITPITIGGTEKYKYTDADGTVHYFEETDKGWVDEDGLGLKLTIGTTHYEITDKQDGKLCFYVDTGRLSQIVDSTGNLLQLYYEPVTASGSTKYYLREIKEIQTGASVTFVRDDVNLHKIIYPDENGTMRHVLFTYTANGDVYHVTQYVLENGSTESYAPTDVISYVASNGVLTEVGGYPYDPSNPPGQSGSVLSGTALVFGYNATGTDALRRRVTSYKLCAYTETEGYTTANIQGTSEYEITVSYGTRSTKYTKAIPNSFTQTELYTFNTYGQTITAQDFDGNAKFQSQGISGGEKNKVTFASNTQRSFINLLKNHNFEKNTGEALPDWPKYGGTGDNAALRGTADGVPTYIGAKAMKVYKGNATQATHSTVKQTVSLTAGKIYTLSAYVYTEIETLDTTNSKAGAFFGVENSDYSIQVYKNAISSASGYTRYFLTVDLTNITTTQNYSVFFGVRNARGAAFFDCVQLEEGNLVNSYNMIENGAFTNTADTVSWTGTGLATTDTIQATSGRNGTPGYRLHGTPSVAKEIHQSIPIAGSAGSSFTAGVWLKGYSLPHRSAETGENVRSCAIKLELKSASGQKQTVTEIIESGLAEWRYICLGAIANFAFTEITLYLTYPYNCNNVTFDEVNLFMDKFGQSFTYDANGNVTSVVDLANNTKNIVTNGNNDMTSYTDGNGNQYRFEYDGGSTTAKNHLLTKVTNPDSSTLSNVYNSFGRVTKSTVSGGGLTMSSSVEYTTNGRFVQSETDAAGATTTYLRDTATGRVNSVQSLTNTVQNGAQVQDTTLSTQYDYDAKTKQLTDVSLYHTESPGYFETVELSPKVSYGYYKGRMTDLLRKSGTGTDVTKQMGYHFTYDAFGKTTAVHWSGKNNTEYLLQNTAYHGWMGVPGTVTYGNGQYVQYHYNRAGQMYRKLANGTAVAKFNYNANNNLGSSAYLRSDNQTFVTTHYFYDLAGRIKETASSLGFTTDKYLFDKNNNVTQYRTGLSDGKVNLAYYTNFTYDNMNALKKLVLCPSGGYGSGTMNFTYDGLHRLKKKDVTLDANTNLAEVYTYEKNGDGSETGRLASVSLSGNFGGNSVSLGYSNTYTANGMIASQTATKNGTPQVTNYSYDELGQLVKETRPGETYTYTYDGGGNILSQSKTTSSGVTSSAYTYDSNMTDLLTKFTTTLPNGTTTSKEYTYNTDAAGNFSFVNPLTIKKSTNGTVTDTWNLGWREGRVLQSIASSAGTVQYEYNENGLRTYKKLANGEKEEYYYNGSQLTVLKHLNAAGNLTYALHFIYDSNGQMQYILYNAPANASNAKIYELYYIVRDLTGAITKLIKTRTGTSTSITPVLQLAAEYSYDPYGKLLGVTTYNGNNIGNINPIRYKDYFYDTETSWYYLTSRYYDPEVGRFLNADAFASTGQGMTGFNMFAYCNNIPVMYSDSEGSRPILSSSTSNETKADRKASFAYMNQNRGIGGSVRYNVPLYDQGKTNLCWAYSQTMIEDYNAGLTRTKDEADARAKEIAISANGTNWNRGNFPTNTSNSFSEYGKSPPTLKNLYSALLETGPIYAYYASKDKAHLVVITGVNTHSGIIYTNNPWGKSGKQSYNEFLNGFAGMPESWDLTFRFVIYPN